MELENKRIELEQRYDKLKRKHNKKLFNEILDVFDLHYADYINGINTDLTKLEEFIMYFTQDKFHKQLHYNIWVSLRFLKPSDLTQKVILLMREKYNDKL